MIKTPLLAAATFATVLLAFTPVQAADANRAWVSGHGTDAAGCGAPANPCRTFQYVHDNVIAAGGEIDVLDPAGYGAVTINKALSIVNDGVGTAGVQAASGNAITINAGSSDNIALRGLNIDGLGTGANGIVFNSGGGLTVINCVVRHFAGSGASGNGVLIQPASGSMAFLIANVIASDNAFVGVNFTPASGAPSAKGSIDHLTAINDGDGIVVDTIGASGGAATIAVSDSIASNNNVGIDIVAGSAATVTVSIDHVAMNDNAAAGLSATHPATVLLGRSVIASNATGVENSTTNTLFTYGDNRINGNGTDISGALNTTFKPQ